MSLSTLRGLLVLGVAAWGLFPFYGMGAFLAVWALLLLSVVAKRRSAGKALEAHREKVSSMVSPEALQWARKHAFFYVWPEEAKAWGLTLKMVSLTMILLALWLGARGMVFASPSVWVGLLPAVVVFFVGTTLGGGLDVPELLNEERYRGHQPHHEELEKVLGLQRVAGQFAPGEPP